MNKPSPYVKCNLCPRRCGIDREAGQRAYCGETSELRIAFAGIHRGEEPPITGKGGSGTIFVSGCNLGCVFCQNYQISQKGMGRVVSTSEFAEICLSLQEQGAENINIVTGSHAAPALALGIGKARKQGLFIPTLWNTSGYEGMKTLEILSDVIDVYLPDLKTLDSNIATQFFNAPDYPDHATAAILKMIEYRKLRFKEKPLNETVVQETLVSGVMVRHLVIPGCLEATKKVLAWFAKNCASKAMLSLMTQYTPVDAKPDSQTKIPERYVSENEYEAVLSMMEEFGIEDGFCQELVTGSDWLPDFTRKNPFSSELSVPVWNC